MKLVVDEAESDALLDELERADMQRRVVASWLLHAELHCAAGRNPSRVRPEAIAAVLDATILVDVTRGDLLSAGTHTPLRSNDAIHLSAALRVGADEMLTYDVELADAARDAGLHVVAPA